MLFSAFADVYNTLMKLTSINDINTYVNKTVSVDARNEFYLWLYVISTFDKKFKINDKHLLTVFCKLQEPHIDRRNLQEAFKANGVAQTCSVVVKVGTDNSTLTMNDVHLFLQTLQKIPSKSFFLLKHFRQIVARCDTTTLHCLINLIRNTNKNKKLFTKKRNLYVFRQVFGRKGCEEMDGLVEDFKRRTSMAVAKNVGDCIRPGKPIEPMLAQPCKSFDAITFKEMCVEVKYNGERLQVHKFDGRITCYKRNLNEHQRCGELKGVVAQMLSHVDNVILDCELVNNGGIEDIIVFDMLYLNGRCLINEKLGTRKRLLNEVVVSDHSPHFRCIEYIVSDDKQLVESWVREVLCLEGGETCLLEGVVIKQWNGVYEPKRKKWFKLKQSYFKNVCSADLVVVGGWRNEKRGGSKRKQITIYLVAAPFYDYQLNKWMFLPVSKVKFSKLNYEHCMEEYNSETCDWLVSDAHLKMLEKVPDMVAKDPLSMPVWEMEGDFIHSDNAWTWNEVSHNYVSIRLPRFIKVRDDKTYRQATTIFDLQLLSTITNNSFSYPYLYEFFVMDNIKNYSLQ
nr:DNA ligase [Cydia pomonella granulovirus]WOZ30344.1 DNA ligase [Cydia pomonella granulovirus]WOZ30469.1 DNA ligase [Cydia pomonella granulovirus]WOZ30601.1 DNA ligase [Cydia pomonella granulovirus]WOZ44870.1 DNA ligase [Cydia pomonella granulovirus]